MDTDADPDLPKDAAGVTPAAEGSASSDQKFEDRMRLPARTLSAWASLGRFYYRTVFVIAESGQTDPTWAPMEKALDLVLGADGAGLNGPNVSYWGEVEIPNMLVSDAEVTEWLRRHPETWSVEAYIGYAAGMRAAASQYDQRSGQLRTDLASKLIELADAIAPFIESGREDDLEPPFTDQHARPQAPRPSGGPYDRHEPGDYDDVPF